MEIPEITPPHLQPIDTRPTPENPLDKRTASPTNGADVYLTEDSYPEYVRNSHNLTLQTNDPVKDGQKPEKMLSLISHQRTADQSLREVRMAVIQTGGLTDTER
jgi:hypothetical protein